MGDVDWAYGLAKDLLATALPRRWAHTQGVAERAESLAPVLGADTDTLIAAALLHDIGYAPDLVDTGMHQLDGARYLRDVAGAGDRLCRLVAYHSCAENEARERELLATLAAEFEAERPDLARALTYCDMTTGPDGRHLDVRDRLAEIHARYGRDHVVSRSITAATSCIVSSVRAVEAALSGTLRTSPEARRTE
ncbi:putative nucleotidyltransferase with HDIG domain [Nonomuraea muscovyensis]|uniref:Putative nucleotidyltransferase with HDIG domain n=1 Tax=Nonomuraea muscovyensis TaxID=1124761 RepID=A0A7X0EVG7_9ACTN|nr:HD domain-containing protein [Nonomuraea muscovyensis]MBB6345513.1 putative nucleotidyltransferase with HDIG domain [Nonomuraea muscovyensis]